MWREIRRAAADLSWGNLPIRVMSFATTRRMERSSTGWRCLLRRVARLKPASALMSGAIGVVIANAGTSGVVTLARMGSAFCSFDGTATVVGDFVVPSSTASSGFYPLCHDAGATQPSWDTSAGAGFAGEFGKRDGADVLGYAGFECEQQRSRIRFPWLTTNTTGTAISFSSTANKAELWGVVLTFPLTTTQVTYDVSTADNTSNTYDIGVLNSSGSVVAHIGSTAGTTFAPSTGWKTLSWAVSATLQPGKYYLAITSSCIKFLRAGLWGNVSGIHVPGRKQWNGGERDRGWNTE